MQIFISIIFLTSRNNQCKRKFRCSRYVHTTDSSYIISRLINQIDPASLKSTLASSIIIL